MRLALIQPLLQARWNSVPVGLVSLASYIKQYCHQPIIIDFNVLSKGKNDSPHFFKQSAKKILKCFPHVIGFGVLCDTLPTALLTAKECKNLAPEIPIIMGGPEVSFDEIEILNNFKQIDIIVRGEGEITLAETLNALEKKTSLSEVLGITFRENNRIIRTPDRPLIKNLDDLPYLDFALLPYLERYEFGRIEGGRGCPFSCTFCSTCKMWKRNFRIKSPQRLAQELREAYRLFKKDENSYVTLIHDNFLFSRKKAEEFLSLIVNDNLVWACSSRLEALDENLVKKLKHSGCRSLYFGIESASPKIQKEIKKNLPLSRLPQVLEMLCQYDIQVTLSFIVGFPNENKSQINKTLLMALRAKLFDFAPNVHPHLLTFLKGSELYSKAIEKFTRDDFEHINDFPSLTVLPAERSLIKKYPHIFPSFYRERNKDGLFKVLIKICILFNFLMCSFPLTTLLLLSFLKTNPLTLGKKMIYFLEAKGVRWIAFFDDKSFFRHYFFPFKDFIKENSNLLIKETFFA